MRTALAAIVLLAGTSALAEVRTEAAAYRHGDVALEGYLAYDDAVAGRRPGALVVHEWWGLNDYARRRARELAQRGYVAFAVDMYGKGIVATTRDDARKYATALRSDRALMRARARAGLDVLLNDPRCDRSRVAAIGYCFGGGAVLELARSGADLAGVVSFHGNLDTPLPAAAGEVRAKVLVLHGADDPGVPLTQVAAFIEEMRRAGVDYQIIFYGGAVHTFTNPAAGNDPATGSAYHEKADRRSWEAMMQFLSEVLKE